MFTSAHRGGVGDFVSTDWLIWIGVYYNLLSLCCLLFVLFLYYVVVIIIIIIIIIDVVFIIAVISTALWIIEV